MEELIKLHSEEKQYCVYAHYYGEQLFYIGSGGVFKTKTGLLRGRPFKFSGRSLEWFKFCNEEIDKVKVEILFVTNNEKISFDKEEEITRMYMDQGFPLVNKNIGTHPIKEQKRKLNEANKGENNIEKSIKFRSEVKQYCVYAHYYEDQLFYIGSGEVYRNNSRGLSGRPFDFGGRSLEWFKFCNEEKDKVSVEILFVTNNEKISFDKEEEITRYYMELEMPLVNKNIGMCWGEEVKRKQSETMSGEGNPMYGKTFSEEHRRKLSEFQTGEKGYWYGKKGKDNPWYGKKHSKETRELISKANKGKKLSPETKQKMSEAHKRGKSYRAQKVLITNNENGEQINFLCIKDAYEFIVEKGYPNKYGALKGRLRKGSYNFDTYIMERIA